MNNNRNSNSNRRRGRNPNRPQGGGGNGGSGGGNQLNRIDSRARGNAPQLLDKYKKLAQDAQHNGDRVQAEYFLQFADHYFRVINDNKIRQDESRAARGGKGGRDDQNDGQASDSHSQRGDDDMHRPRRSHSRQDENDSRDDDRDNDDRGDGARGNGGGNSDRENGGRENGGRSSSDRGDRDNGERSANGRSRGNDDRGRGNGPDRDYDGVSSDDFDDAPAPKVRAKPERAPRQPRAPKAEAETQGVIDIAVLPPAIGKSSNDTPVKRPALRPRRKRADDSEVVV